MLHITSIKFINYKAFKDYSLTLNSFNILIGPNNAGKSTVIGSLKILSEGIKKAKSRRPSIIDDPKGRQILGYEIDLNNVPVATENVFHNYDDESPAIVRFRLNDNSYLQIFFPSKGVCLMNYESDNAPIKTTSEFKARVPLEIGFVPILGPVDHEERLYQKEAARKALLSYTASRNFRNIWYHYGQDFDEFKDLVKITWPGMNIEPPEIDYSGNPPILNMFCPEERIPREIFWAGFGFQVWCQMLTYIIKNRHCSLFLVDEPDIYLHSDLQRQLLSILKTLGPDIIIATHSTELMSEADLNDIIIVNKAHSKSTRIKNQDQLIEVFQVLGSNLNPTLTQIAKTRKVLFVEGKDFAIFAKFARKARFDQVANRANFAVISVEGFNPQRLKAFKEGIEKTIGAKISTAVIFDRDYRSEDQVKDELRSFSKGHYFARIHNCKEVENFVLIPEAIEKAVKAKIHQNNVRNCQTNELTHDIKTEIENLTENLKNRIQAQLQSHFLKHARKVNNGTDECILIEKILSDFDSRWTSLPEKLQLVPGKEFLTLLNQFLQDQYRIHVTPANIIEQITTDLFPDEMLQVIRHIENFRCQNDLLID